VSLAALRHLTYPCLYAQARQRRLEIDGASVDTSADGAPKLGGWSRGIVSVREGGGFAVLLAPADMPGYRAIGQVVKGYSGLGYAEAAMNIPCNPPPRLEVAKCAVVRGVPGEPLPRPLPPPRAQRQPLTVLHFNDVYEVEARSREPVGGAARFVGKLRSYAQSSRRPAVVFSGDVFAPSLMSTVTKGEHMVKYLNMMDITAACIGNHDFDFGTDNLEKLIGLSNFPWLLSNVTTKADGRQLAGGHTTLIVEHEGWKLGFMGLIEQEWLATLATIEPEEVKYRDFVEVAHELCKELRSKGCDLVIGVTQ